MRRRAVLAGATVVGVTGAFSAPTVAQAADHERRPAPSIVGAWYVDAVAPYRPHLFSFSEDGLVLSTNPTNVQSTVASGALTGTTDSVGMGAWRRERGLFVGTMYQENADQPARTRSLRLAVTFKLGLYHGGDYFEGPAVAELLDPVTGKVEVREDSYLKGWRLSVRERALRSL